MTVSARTRRRNRRRLNLYIVLVATVLSVLIEGATQAGGLVAFAVAVVLVHGILLLLYVTGPAGEPARFLWTAQMLVASGTFVTYVRHTGLSAWQQLGLLVCLSLVLGLFLLGLLRVPLRRAGAGWRR